MAVQQIGVDKAFLDQLLKGLGGAIANAMHP